MSWIAVLLIGVGIADLAQSIRPVRIVPECIGATVAVLVGLLAGLTDPSDVVALIAIAGVVVLWGQTVTRGFAVMARWIASEATWVNDLDELFCISTTRSSAR